MLEQTGEPPAVWLIHAEMMFASWLILASSGVMVMVTPAAPARSPVRVTDVFPRPVDRLAIRATLSNDRESAPSEMKMPSEPMVDSIGLPVAVGFIY